MVLYTQGLEYDDRIRKEMLSITNRFPEVTFEIFAVTPINKEEHGVTQYGVKYHLPYLKSRDKYKSGTHVLAKAVDFYRTVSPCLKNFDVVWCADIETFFFPLLLSSKRNIIWDLHELPEPFMKGKLKKKLFRFMERKCRIVYHANQSRIDYLRTTGVITQSVPHIALRNYPENPEINFMDNIEKFDEFRKWRVGRECVYLQGINSPDRLPYESMSAILQSQELCGVIVGTVDSDAKKRIINSYGEKEVYNRLFFTGKVPQLATKLFMKECTFSLVFYKCNMPNNIFCEPNRMFQSIVMGLPVIVGRNPSMKDIVKKYNCGIVLESDGTDIQAIVDAIRVIRQNYYQYKENCSQNKYRLLWTDQEDLLSDSFENNVLNLIN